jgi:hypothetical protein
MSLSKMSATIIIRKQRIVVKAATPEMGLAYRQQLTDGWLGGYTQSLHNQAALVEFPSADLYIDKLQVTLPIATPGTTPADWIPAITDAVMNRLLAQTGGRRATTTTSKRPNADAEAVTNSHNQPWPNTNGSSLELERLAMQQYLAEGTLPSWCRHAGYNPKIWLNALFEKSGTPKTVLSLIYQALHSESFRPNPDAPAWTAVQRLLGLVFAENQPALLTSVLQWAGTSTNSGVYDILAVLEQQVGLPPANFRSILLQFLLGKKQQWFLPFFDALLQAKSAEDSKAESDQRSRQQLLVALAQVAKNAGDLAFETELNGAQLLPPLEPPIVEKQAQIASGTAKKDAVVYSGQAGLALLFPFLPELFTNCDLLTGQGQFGNEQAAQKAVFVLRYLSGKDSEDWDLALEKLVCGLEANTVLPVLAVPLDPGLVQAADELLQAVINHWPPLKQSSAAGLQEAFLQRFGKLNIQGPNWQLHVERMGVDVLLEQLPWTFGMVKLPWLQPLIEVIW